MFRNVHWFVPLPPALIIAVPLAAIFAVAMAPCLLADISWHKSAGENALNLALATPGLLIVAVILHRLGAFGAFAGMFRRKPAPLPSSVVRFPRRQSSHGNRK